MVERVRPKEKVERVSPKLERVRPKEKVERVRPVKKLVHINIEAWHEEERVVRDTYEGVLADELPDYEEKTVALFRKLLKKHKTGIVLVFLIDTRRTFMACRGSLRGIDGKLMRGIGVFDGVRV